jgi:hypothetical protein
LPVLLLLLLLQLQNPYVVLSKRQTTSILGTDWSSSRCPYIRG